MKLGFATTYDARQIEKWSGTPFYMTHAFEQQLPLELYGCFKRELSFDFKLKQWYSKLFLNVRESPRFNVTAAKSFSLQLERKIRGLSINALIAPQINPIAYLETKIPLVLWTDALYVSLLNYYPGFKRHSANTQREGHRITQACVERCTLAIFSSEWAAEAAMRFYEIPRAKIRVVPFGANVFCEHRLSDIKYFLTLRHPKKLKLLFIGKHWERKGGDIVFKVAAALHQANIPLELHFAGCYPPTNETIPPYVICHGFISKNTPAGVAKIQKLLRETHFLFVPSRAEAYGIVFCEANAFGVPCLTTETGGIPTIIKNDVNGKCFSPNANIDEYCEFILKYLTHYSQYESLALSAYDQYMSRLNWQVATKQVLTHLKNLS